MTYEGKRTKLKGAIDREQYHWMQEELEKAWSALWFYADSGTYDKHPEQSTSHIEEDEGKIAREALNL